MTFRTMIKAAYENLNWDNCLKRVTSLILIGSITLYIGLKKPCVKVIL